MILPFATSELFASLRSPSSNPTASRTTFAFSSESPVILGIGTVGTFGPVLTYSVTVPPGSTLDGLYRITIPEATVSLLSFCTTTVSLFSSARSVSASSPDISSSPSFVKSIASLPSPIVTITSVCFETTVPLAIL